MKTVPKIVAIGGGEIREMETAAIDERIIELTGKRQPKALFIPNYHFEKRETSFSQMIAKRGGIGIACDNNAAIEIVGEHYRILTSAPDGKAYKLFKRSGNAHIVEFPQNSEWMPLADLLRRG